MLRWEGDDLLLDNTHVFISGVMWKYFGSVFKLAQHMVWLTTNPRYEFQPGYYHRGPNMLMVPIDKEAPKADYTQESFHDGFVFKEYPNDFSHGPVAVVMEGLGWSSLYRGAWRKL